MLWHADRRLEKVANFLMSCRLIAKTDKKLEAKEFFRHFYEKRSTATWLKFYGKSLRKSKYKTKKLHFTFTSRYYLRKLSELKGFFDLEWNETCLVGWKDMRWDFRVNDKISRLASNFQSARPQPRVYSSSRWALTRTSCQFHHLSLALGDYAILIICLQKVFSEVYMPRLL